MACRCPDCPGRVIDSAPEEDSELLAKFDHLRRLNEGTSSMRLTGCRDQAGLPSDRGKTVPKVDISTKIAYFESEIAKESFNANRSRLSKHELKRKGGDNRGSGCTCTCTGGVSSND